LFVEKEDNKFKAWSNAMIAGGYAYILVDVFNAMTEDEAKKITVDDFKKMKLDEMLTMNRQTGFYQMIEMMLDKGK
jgi:sulfur transfer protein SufE